MRIGIIIISLFLPILAEAADYPSGAGTSGIITSMSSFNPSPNTTSAMIRFVVQGTMANGQSGAEPLWVDASTVEGKAHYANLLAAASQGKTVHIFHYGERLDFGGQTGYKAVIISVDF
jgi:hypothetical protein